ncbi:MAG: xylulokinase, partial [Clostridia bacterium]|nr:xylulokinase [Clostridia bacterium]
GVLSKSGVSPSDIACVSLDAATHTAVILDDDFNVIRPAIYWTDTRSTAEVRYLKENFGEIIEKQVMHSPDTIWSLPELLWIKNNEHENWSKVKKILFAKDYVRHMLTGDYVTDYIEAEGSMMFDINKMEWSGELCDILGIDTAMMPRIVDPLDIVGYVTESASSVCGLCEGTPVLCGTTDTVMEVFASGAVEKGQMTLKLATAGRICVITDRPFPDRNLINYSHIVGGLFYPGTATKSCAASYRWFRDTFGGDYETLDNMACEIPIGSQGLVFHPYLNGELTPYANPNLCADFIGVRASHTKAHFTRAVLEGVAMSMLDCKKTLDAMNIEHENCAAIIGGGGKSPLWRQMISDALGLKLVEMKYADSSFGSAMLAGVAAGIFKDVKDAVLRCNKVVSETLPNAENTAKYEQLFKKYKAVQKALEPIYNGENL